MKPTPRILYFSELGHFILQKKYRFFQSGILSFLFVFSWILFFKEPHFHAQAHFHEAKSHVTETSSALQSILKNMHVSYDQPMAASIMQSQQLLGKVVETLGLQISLKKSAFEQCLLRIKNHLRSSFGLPFSPLEEARFENVRYFFDRPTVFYLHMLTSVEFELLDENKNVLQTGTLGKSLVCDLGSLTLVKAPAKELTGYFLLPKRVAIVKLKNQIKIKPHRLDSNLIQLSCFHPNRYLAIDVLNVLMKSFQDFLQKNHEQVAVLQKKYLEKRQKDLHRSYEEELSLHKEFLEEILKEKGSIGLTQELETLEKLKNEYFARLTELDLISKRWKEIAALHQFACRKKQGMHEVKENLSWKNSSLLPNSDIINKEDFAGLDLDSAQKIYSEYSTGKTHLLAKVEQMLFLQEELEKSSIEFSALTYLLEDPAFQEAVQICSKLSLQLSDESMRNARDLERIRETLRIQKEYLVKHVEKSKDLFQLRLDLVEQNMLNLQRKTLELIEKEKKLLQDKLREIAKKMENYPEKWSREQQLTLKKELAMQIIQGLTELSESKVVDHNLFHIESKPIDLGDAPPEFAPSHLILFSLMGGAVGGFIGLVSCFSRAVSSGFPISILYLRDRGYKFLGQIEKAKYEKWLPLEEKFQKILSHICFAIQEKRRVGVIGFSSFFSHHLAQHLGKKGKTVLCVHIKESIEEKESEITIFDNHFTMSIGEETFTYLQGQNISSKILEENKEIDCVFLHCEYSFSQPEILEFLSQCEIFILGIKGESDRDLAIFPIDQTLCVLQK